MLTADRVQARNPVTKRWCLLDTRTGRMIATKKGRPYEGVPIRARTREDAYAEA